MDSPRREPTGEAAGIGIDDEGWSDEAGPSAHIDRALKSEQIG